MSENYKTLVMRRSCKGLKVPFTYIASSTTSMRQIEKTSNGCSALYLLEKFGRFTENFYKNFTLH